MQVGQDSLVSSPKPSRCCFRGSGEFGDDDEAGRNENSSRSALRCKISSVVDLTAYCPFPSQGTTACGCAMVEAVALFENSPSCTEHKSTMPRHNSRNFHLPRRCDGICNVLHRCASGDTVELLSQWTAKTTAVSKYASVSSRGSFLSFSSFVSRKTAS